MRFNELLTTWPTVSERRDSKVPKSKNILLPSSCTDGFSSFRPFLAYRSLGTVGFRDVTETNGRAAGEVHRYDVTKINLGVTLRFKINGGDVYFFRDFWRPPPIY